MGRCVVALCTTVCTVTAFVIRHSPLSAVMVVTNSRGIPAVHIVTEDSPEIYGTANTILHEDCTLIAHGGFMKQLANLSCHSHFAILV